MTDYFEHRHLIKSGDLLVWSKGSLTSIAGAILKGVQIATQSRYDHVGLAWNIGDRLFFIEATYPEVRIYPLSKSRPFYHLAMGIEWREDYEKELLDLIGEKYSLMELLRAWLGYTNDDREWQCAEMITHFYKNVYPGVDFGYTPNSIVEASLKLSKSGLVLVV